MIVVAAVIVVVVVGGGPGDCGICANGGRLVGQEI